MLGSFATPLFRQAGFQHYLPLNPQHNTIRDDVWRRNPYQLYGILAPPPIMTMTGVDFETTVGSLTIAVSAETINMTGVDFATEVGSIDVATVVRSECRIGHELTPFFLEQQQLTNPRSIVRQFTFNNSAFSDRVIAYPKVKRAYKDVVGSPFNITLENASKLLNDIIEDRTKFRKEGEVTFGYQFNPSHVDFGCIAKGFLINANYSDSQVTLGFKNQMDILSQVFVSTDTTSQLGASFINSNYSPADMTFEILTANSYGAGLDNTTSQANTDIDYQSWLDWKNTLGSESIVVQGFFPYGTNYVQALQGIAEITDSAIYVEANNKIVFRRNLTGQNSFSAVVSASDIIQFDAKGDAYDMCNRYTIPLSFTVSSNQISGPASTVTRNNASSINSFGVLAKQPTSNLIWYVDTAGAANLGDRIIFRRREPELALSITTPLKYLQQQLGDIIFVNIDEVNLSNQPYTLISQEIDIGTMTQKLELSVGHGIAVSNVTVFELDDPDLGTLNNTLSVLA